MKFCQEPYLSQIKHLFNSHLGIPKETVDASYNEFVSRFSSEKEDDTLVEVPVSKLKFDQNVISNQTSYGVDLPIWFDSGNERKRVALMAMDPYRDFCPSYTEYADVNSPFSIHKRDENDYLPLILEMANRFNLFVTDIFKIYFMGKSEKDKVSNSIKEFKSMPIHTEILKAEMKIFKPDFILCLGNAPMKNGLMKTDKSIKLRGNVSGKLYQYSWNGIPAFFIPHVSGASRGGAKDFINANSNKEYSSSTYGLDALEIVLNKLKEN